MSLEAGVTGGNGLSTASPKSMTDDDKRRLFFVFFKDSQYAVASTVLEFEHCI